MKEIGETVARLRRAKKWSQSELAERAQVSRSFLSTLERGVATDAGVRKVDRILGLFGYCLVAKPQAAPPTLEDLQRAQEDEHA
ncbi:helix-turn-helix domain-containing protein [Desulfocurvus vexinensis]|uniref:helix-turn-helix domain-containing protein n=1 Tax=Desulfocurvus vexinensis TaxID=399548 RepID=UPI000A06F0D1|nr:helix-turn-helix transcriptional regulator [Desulfocurvus vexinensis]